MLRLSEQEKQGGLKPINIDPPFDVGADFSMDIEIGGDTFTGKPDILEDLAYRDTCGKGVDSLMEEPNVAHECPPGRRKIAMKVVDIFGNDTMTIVEVSV